MCRPEKFNHQGAPFSLHDLYIEIIGDELTPGGGKCGYFTHFTNAHPKTII